MEYFLLFGIFVICLLVLLATGLPVAASLGLVGIIGGVLFISPKALNQMATIAFTQSSSFVLIVVPLFVLMSELIANTTIGEQLFRAAQSWLGRLPGSLAMGSVLSCAGFAAVCGSSPVTAATIGKIAIPQMEQFGYDRRLALGATAAGGTLGILIPPSVALIMYGVITETSIGDLFIAGIIPGLIIAGLLCLTVFVMVLVNPSLAPKVTVRVNLKEKLVQLLYVIPILVIAVAVMGSIYTGIATPTESAAVGVAATIVIILLLRQFKFKTLFNILGNTVRTTGMFFLLIIGGLFASFVLTRLRIPQGMAEFILSQDIPGWVIILIINLLLLVMGMFLDPMSILVIVVPLFFPVVTGLGYDPVWFGIMVTINCEIGAITPPVGFNLFVLKSVLPDVKMMEVIKGSLIFIVPLLIGLGLIIVFPDLALYLPAMMK